MDWRRLSWLWAVLTTLLGACPSADPATEVVVVVHSDLEAGSELTKLRVEVFEGKSKTKPHDHEFALSKKATRAGEYTLPLSYSVLPRSESEAASFRLVVTGRGRVDGKEQDLVQRQVIATFTPGVRTLLDVSLDRTCLDVLCREGETSSSTRTCLAGVCAAIPTQTLEPAGAGIFGGFMTGRLPDAGRDSGRDASQDAKAPPADTGPAPQCEEAGDCEGALAKAVPAECATAECVDGRCLFRPRDGDGDAHGRSDCSLEGYPLEPGDDCDDADATLYPGAWDGPLVEGLHEQACDDRDNDCDGEKDEARHEGKSCQCDPATDVQVDCSERSDGSVIVWPAPSPVGSCQAGKRTCADGVWGKCTGAIEPAANDGCEPGNDADCDGMPNEDCPCLNGESRPCGTDLGVCQAGTLTCSNGKWSTTCVGAVQPQGPDTCDPMNDNDCDGMPNEGCQCVNGTTTTCGKALNAKGACASRSVMCKGGKWQAAMCAPTQVEVCIDDNTDEDCDGEINDRDVCQCTNGRSARCSVAYPGTLGECRYGNAVCANGRYGGCSVMPAGKDTCALLGGDENCNGKDYENCGCIEFDSQDCTGPSGCPGTQTCTSAGVWNACRESCPEPAPTM